MFIHATEAKDVTVLFRGGATCRACSQAVEFTVYAEDRTTSMAGISSTNISRHLLCGACGAIFDVTKLTEPTATTFDLHALIERCGKREYPAFLTIMMFLWYTFLIFPFFGLIFAWKTADYRKYMIGGGAKRYRILVIISVVVTALWMIPIGKAFMNK